MKRIALLLIAASSILACNTSDTKTATKTDSALSEQDKVSAEKDSSNYTTIQWLDSTSMKLGTVKKGEVVEVAYRFRNTGDKQLVITDVSAGCGCTVPEKPTQPYAPGAEGVIKAKFDSKNQAVGVPHTKSVSVRANTTPNVTHNLSFTVEIKE